MASLKLDEKDIGYVDADRRKIIGSSPSRVGDLGLSSDRVEHAGEDFQAQVLLVA